MGLGWPSLSSMDGALAPDELLYASLPAVPAARDVADDDADIGTGSIVLSLAQAKEQVDEPEDVATFDDLLRGMVASAAAICYQASRLPVVLGPAVRRRARWNVVQLPYYGRLRLPGPVTAGAGSPVRIYIGDQAGGSPRDEYQPDGIVYDEAIPHDALISLRDTTYSLDYGEAYWVEYTWGWPTADRVPAVLLQAMAQVTAELFMSREESSPVSAARATLTARNMLTPLMPGGIPV